MKQNTDAKRELLLGNEAMARGLLENDCRTATAYPGTPSSEILFALAKFNTMLEGEAGRFNNRHIARHIEWSVNEKIAFEIAYASAISGLRSAVVMKQVGLNVASDPLMSAAYMGTKGGFLVISADDPGPHSSQTEQDSRLMAVMAKIPVLDPESPEEAKEVVGMGFEMSEAFGVPVMIRPTTRVCHSRQDVELKEPAVMDSQARFEKNPQRWAATPKFRYKLHLELEEKLDRLSEYEPTKPSAVVSAKSVDKAIIVSGVASAHVREILGREELKNAAVVYKVIQPYPLHKVFVEDVLEKHEEILVIEETMGVMEDQLASRDKVRGKRDGFISKVGELSPEIIETALYRFLNIDKSVPVLTEAPGKRPTLCAGCPHRASFYAVKKAAPKGIYTSDIGCYTLGLNLGAVDTVLCMGAAVSQAMGFYHAHKDLEKRPEIIATMGDSTFFHSGVTPLINAVVQNIPIVLVVLDNSTTAMTGNQPTPATGTGISGEALGQVDIAGVVKGLGITFCKTADPYKIDEFTALIKEAIVDAENNARPAVIISKHPCILDKRSEKEHATYAMSVGDACDGCGYCVTQFECPALSLQELESPIVLERPGKKEKTITKRVAIDPFLCIGCGVCTYVCPKQSLIAEA